MRDECRATHGIKEMISKEDAHEFNTTFAELLEVYLDKKLQPCHDTPPVRKRKRQSRSAQLPLELGKRFKDLMIRRMPI